MSPRAPEASSGKHGEAAPTTNWHHHPWGSHTRRCAITVTTYRWRQPSAHLAAVAVDTHDGTHPSGY
eukprot:1162037-Pelagomonas_calceolata.AAC.4